MIGRPRVGHAARLSRAGARRGAARTCGCWSDRAQPDRQLKGPAGERDDAAQLEALLVRVAPALPADIRVKLAEAVLAESARAGYDPLFIRRW